MLDLLERERDVVEGGAAGTDLLGPRKGNSKAFQDILQVVQLHGIGPQVRGLEAGRDYAVRKGPTASPMGYSTGCSR